VDARHKAEHDKVCENANFIRSILNPRHEDGPNKNADRKARVFYFRLACLASAEAAAATAATAAETATGAAAASARFRGRLRLHREKAFALQFLASELAGAADGFRLLARLLFGGLLVVATQLHFAENALALHLLLQRLESLIDVIVANENLHVDCLFSSLE